VIYYIVLACLLSYLFGSLPFGLWIGLVWKKVDVRTLGSKNIGATNVLRVLGPGPAALSFALDVLKGAVGVILMRVYLPQAEFHWLVLVGLCAVLGHTFSIFLGFKGGKGIATSLGLFLALSWPVALGALAVWLVITAITRYVSLASVLAALALPFISYFLLQPPERTWMLLITTLLAVLVTVKHLPNIKRLLAGTEAKIGQKVDKDGN